MYQRSMLAGVSILALALAVCYWSKQQAVAFNSVEEVRFALGAAGYHCYSDAASGDMTTGFLVSRESVTLEEVCGLCKAGDMGPEWKGKIWVTINPDYWQVYTIPDQADARVWGVALAYGDHEFLAEIDAALETH